jgi:hypothetical protein
MTVTVDIEPAPAVALPSWTADLPNTLAFVIRQEHIDNGVRDSGWGCAAQLALMATGQFKGVTVGYHSTRINGESYWNSSALTEWIEDFDRGLPVAPERFVLTKATPNP